MKFTLPPDSSGISGAKNFYLWFMFDFVKGRPGQTGCSHVMLVDKNNKLIAGVFVESRDMSVPSGVSVAGCVQPAVAAVV